MTATPVLQDVGMWTFDCPIGDCPTERVHRPYAKARGKNHRKSVSDFAELASAVGGFDGAAFAAAEVTATYCYWKGQDYLAMPMDEAVDIARRVHKAQWKTDADLGTESHRALEAFIANRDWSEPTHVEGKELYDHDRQRLWQFASGVARWCEVRQPVASASEFIVANTHPAYVGTGDLIVDLDGEPTIVDLKTHRKDRDDESKSFSKWWVQLHMLALADSLRHYHGTQLVSEVRWDETTLPRPTKGLIVSVSPSAIREYECDIDPDGLSIVASIADVLAFKPKMLPRRPIPKYDPRPEAPVNVDAMLG